MNDKIMDDLVLEQFKNTSPLTKLIKEQREEFRHKHEGVNVTTSLVNVMDEQNKQNTTALLEEVLKIVNKHSPTCGGGKCNAVEDIKQSLQEALDDIKQ